METNEATLDKNEDLRSSVDVSAWVTPFAIAGATAIGVVLVYFVTFRAMASIWLSSGTYAHGFFILPISLFLIWDERDKLIGATARPTYLALVFGAGLGLGWLVCRLAGVNVLEQYFAVSIAIVAMWGVLGTDVAKRFIFPLGFLLTAVPVGDSLLPVLIDQTAAVTVATLRLSGLAVLQDGTNLTLASGRWSVVEACSGLRYLIASVTLGLLYAHLSYRSWTRRIICVIVSIVVPIIANWARAYMIVMLGHLSDMRLAVGVDHLIYGWVFFGIIVMIMFWVGSFFREDDVAVAPEELRVGMTAGSPVALKFALVGVALVGASAVWPIWAARADGNSDDRGPVPRLVLPDRAGSWTLVGGADAWVPQYVGSDVEAGGLYANGPDLVALYLACYMSQSQGHELISTANRLVEPGDKVWAVLTTTRHRLERAGRQHTVDESVVEGASRNLVWSWYSVEGRATAERWLAELSELEGKLLGEPSPACGVHVSTPVADTERARDVLGAFVEDGLPEVERALPWREPQR